MCCVIPPASLTGRTRFAAGASRKRVLAVIDMAHGTVNDRGPAASRVLDDLALPPRIHSNIGLGNPPAQGGAQTPGRREFGGSA